MCMSVCVCVFVFVFADQSWWFCTEEKTSGGVCLFGLVCVGGGFGEEGGKVKGKEGIMV